MCICCASVVGCLMYVQVCTHLESTYAINVLGRFNLCNYPLGNSQKVLRYLQCSKDSMMIFQNTADLCVVENSDSYFAGCHEIYMCLH